VVSITGLTETCVVATFTSAHDIWHGSSGSLLPDFRLRIVGPDGEDIEELKKPGELLFKSPTIFAGYLGDDEANRSAFDADGWLRTGDVGLMKMGRNGAEHLFIVDRIKDMIKVKVS
jgi:long-subunit acyl-CoA synthetase (AMP-forming)